MISINKQRFLAELGKLLTFMYDEDKQTALGMYAELFDSLEDEEETAKALVSPTRQAVVIARAYDPAQSEEEDYGEEPDFITVIRKTVGEAEAKVKGKSKVSEDQFTFFQPAETPAAPKRDSTDSFLEELDIDGIIDEVSYGTVGDGEEDDEFIDELINDKGTVSKVSAGMLIFFLLIFIPLGLAAVALMIVFALLCFAIAVGAAFLAFYTVSAAFKSGFDIIADILVVGGLSVVLSAVALLALWAGVWFLIGAIPGIIRGIIELGGKFCRREVAA